MGTRGGGGGREQAVCRAGHSSLSCVHPDTHMGTLRRGGPTAAARILHGEWT